VNAHPGGSSDHRCEKKRDCRTAGLSAGLSRQRRLWSTGLARAQGGVFTDCADAFGGLGDDFVAAAQEQLRASWRNSALSVLRGRGPSRSDLTAIVVAEAYFGSPRTGVLARWQAPRTSRALPNLELTVGGSWWCSERRSLSPSQGSCISCLTRTLVLRAVPPGRLTRAPRRLPHRLLIHHISPIETGLSLRPKRLPTSSGHTEDLSRPD